MKAGHYVGRKEAVETSNESFGKCESVGSDAAESQVTVKTGELLLHVTVGKWSPY